MMTTISMHQYKNEITTAAYLHNNGIGPGCWVNVYIGEATLTIHFEKMEIFADFAQQIAKHAERLQSEIFKPVLEPATV